MSIAKAEHDVDKEKAVIPGTSALIKGISLLKSVSNASSPPSFSNLQKKTKLPKGTLHRILKALISEGLLRYDSSKKTYSVGLELFSLASQALDNIDLRDVSRNELVRLRDLTGETVHLAILDGLKAVYVDVVESSHAVAPVAKIGTSSEFHNSAVGKVIAANLSVEDLAIAINQMSITKTTPATITSRRKLKVHLETIRMQGFALNAEEGIAGIHGIAAPLFGVRGSVIGAICITIPSYRYQEVDCPTLAAAVIDSAKAVSRKLGHVSI